MNNPTPCDLVQHADQTICYTCGLQWKTGWAAEPPCAKNFQRRAEDLLPEPVPYFSLALVSLVGALLLIHWLLSGGR